MYLHTYMRPVKIQISLGIHSIWSDFNWCILVSQGCKVCSCGQWRLWSDCVEAQADLNLRCAHTSEGTSFFDVVALLYFYGITEEARTNTKTYLFYFDPLKPHFYIVKLGFAYIGYIGVYVIFLISDQKHRLWVLVRTAFSRRF